MLRLTTCVLVSFSDLLLMAGLMACGGPSTHNLISIALK